MSAPTVTEAAGPAQQAWEDILADLRERNIIEIHGIVEGTLKHACRKTIGDYIECALKQPGGINYWKVEPFRRFAFASAVMMVFRAQQIGGATPDRAQMRQAVDEIVEAARDKYCRTLDDCPPPAPAARGTHEDDWRGGVCPTGGDDIDWTGAP